MLWREHKESRGQNRELLRKGGQEKPEIMKGEAGYAGGARKRHPGERGEPNCKISNIPPFKH